MSKKIADKLRFSKENPMFKLTCAKFTSKSLLGVVNNSNVKVENCIVPIDFHMLEMRNLFVFLLLEKVCFYLQ